MVTSATAPQLPGNARVFSPAENASAQHDHLYTLKKLRSSDTIDTSVRLRWHVCCLNYVLMLLKYLSCSSMELYFGAVLWACLNVQQSKQLHMIDRNVGVMSCIVQAIL